MEYIVYKTTCLINNKIYIGVHRTENSKEFDGYLGRGLYKNHNKYINNPIAPFHYAVKKYGVDNFVREVLFTYDNAEDAFNKEAELVNEDFIKRDDVYNVCLGGKGRPRSSRQVYQFDFEGNLLRSYESALEASKIVEVSISNINEAISFKRTSAESLWAITNVIDVSEYKITRHNKYYIYDQDGNYITYFDHSKDCIAYLDTNSGNLQRAIKTSGKVKGYFVTCEKLDKLKVIVTKLSGKLNRYTIDGVYIDSFDSVRDAKEKLNLKLTSISTAIKLNRTCNGFRWTRTDTPTPTININNL